jgi:cytochrome c peroxidase
MDGLARSKGINGQVEARNTPTVLNAAINFRQFWDGRADSLESQADSPLTSPSEMASTWPELIRKLGADKAYRQAFDDGYADGLTARNVRDAIATFERTLIITGSPFDRFLMGDASSLSPAEGRGYDLFRSVGCVSCHQGANVGGNMYERLGVIRPYFDSQPAAAKADLGRFAVTRREEDRYVFRVPSLRFVASTAPYLHDGSLATLDETIRVMATHQLGRRLSQRDVDDIARFLHSLAGRLPE